MSKYKVDSHLFQVFLQF